MMKGGHTPTKLLHALTWGAFDHASRAPQVRACTYYIQQNLSFKKLLVGPGNICMANNYLCTSLYYYCELNLVHCL